METKKMYWGLVGFVAGLLLSNVVHWHGVGTGDMLIWLGLGALLVFAFSETDKNEEIVEKPEIVKQLEIAPVRKAYDREKDGYKTTCKI